MIPFILSAVSIASRVVPSAPLRVIERAQEMLKGDIMIFCELPSFSATSLKISKANEFSDSIRAICLVVSSISTGSFGKSSSGVLVHFINKRRMDERTNTDAIILFFMYLAFKD